MSITESEIAGFGVGALLLAASIAAPRIDAFIARAQRRSVCRLDVVELMPASFGSRLCQALL